MKHITSKPYSDHQELAQLLPWYVNKTLQGSELRAVEDHLAVCLVCKRELLQLQKLAQLVAHSGSIDSAEQASFSRLKKRLQSGQQLDLQALPKPAQTDPIQDAKDNKGNVRPFNASKQKWKVDTFIRPALAMAAALLLSLTVIMPRYAENDLQTGNQYRTLSSDSQLASKKTNEIRVVFAENVNQQQKEKILERVQGQIVDKNPTAQGVYTVRLKRDIAENHITDAIELLRKDNKVIFAEPAYALLSSTQVEK
jgi:hypothetical protein